MAIKMKVGVTFGGKDETSKIFKRMGNSADKFGRRSKSAFDKASRSAKGFGRITKGILGAQLITGGLAKIRQGAGIISSQFLDFGDTITQAAVKFKDIGPKAGNFAEKLKEIKKEARGIAESTIFTAPQVAVAFKQLAQGGFKYETALKAMNGQIEFALATSEDFTLANKVSTKILGGFGLAVNDPIQKVKNLAFVNDILAKTVNNSSINLEQFFDAAKQIGPIARSLGSSLPEVASFVGVLGNSAIDASQAMTGLRNIFLRMSSPTTETARALKRIGLSLFDDQGKAKNMTQFLGELAEKVKGFSEKKRAGLFKDLFETRGIASAIILTDEINTGVKDFRTQIDGAKGEVAAMAKIMQNTLLSKIKLLQSASTELGFKFVEIFETKGRALVDALSKSIGDFDIKPIKELFDILEQSGKDTKLGGPLLFTLDAIARVVKLIGRVSIATIPLIATIIGDVVGGIEAITRLVTGEQTPEEKKQEKLDRQKRVSAFKEREAEFLRVINADFIPGQGQGLTSPNEAAANNVTVPVNITNNVTGNNPPNIETKVSRKKINRSALGSNNVLQGAFP